MNQLYILKHWPDGDKKKFVERGRRGLSIHATCGRRRLFHVDELLVKNHVRLGISIGLPLSFDSLGTQRQTVALQNKEAKGCQHMLPRPLKTHVLRTISVKQNDETGYLASDCLNNIIWQTKTRRTNVNSGATEQGSWGRCQYTLTRPLKIFFLRTIEVKQNDRTGYCASDIAFIFWNTWQICHN